jgi:hypothetical protein
MSGLKKNMGDIQRAVQILAGTYDKDLLSFEVAKVKSVDTKNWLCEVQLVSGNVQTVYSNVQLTSERGSNGFIQVPKIWSNVILAITWRNEKYVFMCSEIDALVFHQLNSDGKTYEEFVINCNSNFNPALPLGIQLADGGGNGVTITSGTGIPTNVNGSNGVVISNGTANISNSSNGIVINNSTNPVTNGSSGILISCSGNMQLNGNTFGGLVKLVDPTDISGESGVLARLLNIENWINTFVGPSGAFTNHGHICPPGTAGGPTVGPPIVTAAPPTDPPPDPPLPSPIAIPTLDYTTRQQLENTDISHAPLVS